MLNPAIEDVLRLIELRSRFDQCQRQLLEVQTENSLLKATNLDLRLRLALTKANDDDAAVDSKGCLSIAK